MDRCNLVDLGDNGPKFTWTNKRKRNPIFERLDRGCANPKRFQLYPNASLWHLPRITSEHYPILLRLEKPPFPQGEKPFRFEPMWLLDSMFRDDVLKDWPRPCSTIQDSLSSFRESLIEWNWGSFGNIYHRKRTLLARLKGTRHTSMLILCPNSLESGDGPSYETNGHIGLR